MSLQQRLLGAILLIALGVIFIPVLLDGAGYKSRQQREIEMPPRPEFPPLEETALKPVVPTHLKQQRQPAPPLAAVAPPSEPEPVQLQPAFTEDDQKAMVFDAEPSARPVPNLDKLKAFDSYISWLREQ